MSEMPTAAALVTVRLVGLPVPIHIRAAEHMEALAREFEIIRRADASTDSVPARLHALIDELDGQFTAFTAQPLDELRRAIAHGDPTVDLVFHLPAAAANAAARLRTLLDEADSYCEAGQHLLTLAPPADTVAYRRWFLDEFTRQADGQPSRPWVVGLCEDAEQDQVIMGANDVVGEDQLASGWDISLDGTRLTVRLAGDLDLQTAPLLREVLTQVSDDVETVVVDLAAVSFLDSVGISVLIAAYQRLTESGTGFAMRAGPRILRTLTIAGVADILQVSPAEPVGPSEPSD